MKLDASPSNPRIPFQMSTERLPLAPPDGKPLIVHLTVAIENYRYDAELPRQILSLPHGVRPVPDIPNWSWTEYGMRCGMPRLFRALESRGLKADACINASVIDLYPSVAEKALRLGWEFQGHGLHQRALSGGDEVEIIDRTLARLQQFCGYRPRGWIGPGLTETHHTPDHLKKAGIVYTCDWVLDDLPCWMSTAHGPLIAVPYTLELNDAVIFMVEKHPSEEHYNRVRHTLETFEAELAESPRVLSIVLHYHVSGVPHRMPFVEKILDLLLARNDAVFMTGGEIADWFAGASPAPASMTRHRP